MLARRYERYHYGPNHRPRLLNGLETNGIQETGLQPLRRTAAIVAKARKFKERALSSTASRRLHTRTMD